jgi:hypothetical protein
MKKKEKSSKMLIKDHNLPMLNSCGDWTDWIISIEDLAVRNDVWNYCDPEGIGILVFPVTKPPDSANKDTIQKFHSLGRSIESCVSKIPQGQVPEMSRAYFAGGSITLNNTDL